MKIFTIVLVTMATLAAPAAATDWGAIATGQNGAMGYSFNQDSKEAATTEAMRHCTDPSCAIDETFQNTCASIGFMQSGARANFHWEFGTNEDATRANIRVACSKANTDGWEKCQEIVTFCSLGNVGEDPMRAQ